jgi:hypothetical protein
MSVAMPSSFKYSMNVRFIRAEDVDGNGKHDDRAVITKEDNGVFILTFHHNNGKKTITKEMMLDDDGVVRWFNRTLRFVDADYVPYARYQFDFPMMPSVMIAHVELHHHHKTIMSAVRFHIDNWFTENDFDFCEMGEDAPHPSNIPNPEDLDWDNMEDEDEYESNNVNNCCDDDHSSLSSEEYTAPPAKHKFFTEDGNEKTNNVRNLIQKMESASNRNLRR